MSIAMKFQKHLEVATSPEAAVAAMDAFLHKHVGDCYFLLGETGSIWILPQAAIGTYPPEWLEIYYRRNYFFDDATMKHATKSAAPFKWSEVAYETDHERNIMKLVQDYDLVEGIV